MCRLFGKSRDFYYKAKARQNKEKNFEQQVLRLVKDERKILRKVGYRKLYNKLKPVFLQKCIKVGRDKFYKILKDNNLLLKRKKFKKPKTDSDHPYRKHRNLIENLPITHPNQVWVSDITYIRVRDQWNYLTLVTDLFSRKIVGWHFDKGMKISQTTRPAVDMAIKERNRQAKSKKETTTTTTTILHSDRGFQYCNPTFVKFNHKNNITPSMTKNGDPYENAVAERVNGILKYEFELKDNFASFQDALFQIQDAVYLYNNFRTHFSLNLKTPQQVYSNKLASNFIF